MDPEDPIRRKHEALLLEKLYDMGILGTEGAGGRGKLSEVEKKVTVSSLARRRLAVVMTRLKMGDNVQAVRASCEFTQALLDAVLSSLHILTAPEQTTKFIEQGHVRCGVEVVTDPAFLVTRNMQDFVTWVDSSKIKRNILKYRDKLDDFDLL